MNKLLRGQQGESIPFRFDRDGGTIEGWVCTIFLVKRPGDVDLLTGSGRVIPPRDRDRSFPGYLTNTETGPLDIALYYLIAALVNVSTNEYEEIQARVDVTESWVT
jgi:hypothetical protein